MRTLSILMVVIMAMAVGCNKDWVEPGQLGRVKTTSGWQDELLAPGRYSMGYKSSMYTLDATEATFAENMKILMKGNINLTLTVEVRCGVDATRTKEALSVFDRVPAGRRVGEKGVPVNKDKRHIPLAQVYKTYGKMTVQSVPRKLFSPLKVEEFQDQRVTLSELLDKKIRDALLETPLKASAVEITNIDWPKVITAANIQAKQREIEIKAEEAKVKKDIVAAQGALKVAEEQYKVSILEAKMVADSNKLIADSLKDNPEYLQWHNIKVLGKAAEGPNNAFIIIPYAAMGSGQDLLTPALLKQMLDERIVKTPAPIL